MIKELLCTVSQKLPIIGNYKVFKAITVNVEKLPSQPFIHHFQHKLFNGSVVQLATQECSTNKLIFLSSD